MKKIIIALILLTSTTAFAGQGATSVTCRSESGSAIGRNSKKVEIKTASEDTVIRFRNNSLLSTVQFVDGRLIQMMVESTKTFTFTQLNMQKLVENGKGEVFLQDLKENGDYMEVSCEISL